MPTFIPGGSSSGSAVAVSAGLVSFSLGTDTAGSGRVPAGFNNIVGLKPTPGLLSTEGVVPACRSLDCVSVFALSCADADAVLKVAGRAAGDAGDRQGLPLRRAAAPRTPSSSATTPMPALYAQAIGRLKAMGGTPVEIDYAPFRDAAQLLYSGPWVAERTAAVGAFIEGADDEAGVWPVTREIILARPRVQRRRRLRGPVRARRAEGARRRRDGKASTSSPCRPPARSIAWPISSASRCSTTRISATTPTSSISSA